MQNNEVEIREEVDLSYIDSPHAKYPKELKIKAAATYLTSGNVTETAMICGVDVKLISDWKQNSKWWPQLIDDMRKAKQDQLDAVLTTAIDGLLDKLGTRIEQGDPYVKKDGTIGYLPVKTKDLAVTMAVLYDKRALVRGEATSIRKESTESLKTLENRFKEFALQLKEKDVVANQ